MSQSHRSKLAGAELEKLQRWRMHLADEFKEILEEVDALKPEPLADHSDARKRREGSQARLPDSTELQGVVEELVNEAREYAALESAIGHPDWFSPIERLILQATAYLDTLFYETGRILDEATACQHPFTCPCQRQLRLVDERIKPILKELDEFIAYAEALKKRL